MANFKKFIRNYIDQMLTLNQLVRLNSPLKNGNSNIMTIKTHNKHIVKDRYLFLLIWNTFIHSVEVQNYSTFDKIKIINVYFINSQNVPVRLHRGFILTRDKTFDDYWSEIQNQINYYNDNLEYINITIRLL